MSKIKITKRDIEDQIASLKEQAAVSEQKKFRALGALELAEHILMTYDWPEEDTNGGT